MAMASKRHPRRGFPSLVILTCHRKSRSTHVALHRTQLLRGLTLPDLLPLLLLFLSLVSPLLPVEGAAENIIVEPGAWSAIRTGAWKEFLTGPWKGTGKGKGGRPGRGKGKGGSHSGSGAGTGADSGTGGGSGTGSGSESGKSDGSGEIIRGGGSGKGNGTGSGGQSNGGGGSKDLTVEQQAKLAEVNKLLGFLYERRFTGAAMGISRSGLDETLMNTLLTSNVTIFAPTNGAFFRMPKNVRFGGLQRKRRVLWQVMASHILPRRMDINDIKALGNGFLMEALDSSSLKKNETSNRLRIVRAGDAWGARVLIGNMFSSPSIVVHAVDTVLLPVSVRDNNINAQVKAKMM